MAVDAEDEAVAGSTAAVRAAASVAFSLADAVKAMQAPKASKRVLKSPSDELASLLPKAAEASTKVAELEAAIAEVQGQLDCGIVGKALLSATEKTKADLESELSQAKQGLAEPRHERIACQRLRASLAEKASERVQRLASHDKIHADRCGAVAEQIAAAPAALLACETAWEEHQTAVKKECKSIMLF